MPAPRPEPTSPLVPPSLCVVVSGPSGAGKGTLIAHLLAAFPDLERVTTYTTRAPRPGEADGVDYRFVSEAEFERLLGAGAIAEYTRTYGAHAYGSPTRLFEDDGTHVITELDPKGAYRLKAASPRQVVAIFVLPPSVAALRERIIARHAGEDGLERRLQVAADQLQHAWAYDYVLENDDRDRFEAAAAAVLQAELLQREGRATLLRRQVEMDDTLTGGV